MKLLTPFKSVFGETIVEIKIPTVLTVGDVMWMLKQGTGAYEQSAALLARLSGCDIKDIEKMDVRDFDGANKLIQELQELPKSVS